MVRHRTITHRPGNASIPIISASKTHLVGGVTVNDSEPPTVATAAECDCAGCPDEKRPTRADAGHRTGLSEAGKPGLRAKLCALLPSGGCRLASYPARSEPAAGSGADGRRPGRGTASAAGRTGPPPAEQRAAVVVLPLVPAAGLPADGTSATDLAVVELNAITYQACRGDFVVPDKAPVCSYGIKKAGWYAGSGDPLEVAQWLQACHDAGMEVRADK